MDFLFSRSATLLLSFLSTWFWGFSSVLGQHLRETDALCNADGCFVVYFERKIFLDSWRTCKEKGGNLATVKRKEDANAIATLFSNVDLPQSHTKVRVWIGLQRQPRQCNERLPLRGFSWTTGDQDTEYTNWQREYSPSLCMIPRCIAMGYDTQELSDNFKWLDSSCSVPVDGYLCHFAFKGMCSALWSEHASSVVYTTPFNLVSTLLTHVPFGSVANKLCSTDTTGDWSPIQCTLKEDGSVGWSREPPLCSDFSISKDPCDQNNGGCDHLCSVVNGQFFCECADDYHLGDDGQSCELTNACQRYPCEGECLILPDGYRCACPDGYMLAPDEHACLDVDECSLSPCEQLCKNTPGTFECLCFDGYILNDKNGCDDIDECTENPCEHTCVNTPGSHFCLCDGGFTFDPQDPSRCQDIDECQIARICDQMCVNYEGTFDCYCKEGYELMSDGYTCQKVEGDEYRPMVTQKPGLAWDVVHYPWNPESSNTPWPKEEDQYLDWLSETQRSLDSGGIPVTSIPQDEHSFDINPQTESAHLLESERPILSTISSSTTSDWNKDGNEETTTAHPLLPVSTISEGAWIWWSEWVTSTQSPEIQEQTRTKMSAELGTQKEAEEKPLQRELPQFPEEGSENDKNYMEITHTGGPAAPFQFTTSQPLVGDSGRGGVTLDPDQKDKEQKSSSTGLLVGLLVPVCIFVLVMVALCIIYGTHCTVKPKNKNSPKCYHWISGAHDKQGAPNLSTGVKAPV